MSPSGAGPDSIGQLVLVTGAARSGTSTMAGVFARLGWHVPMPVLKANNSNPRGFYESWWPVRFHNKLLDRAGVSATDTRPSAATLLAGSIDTAAREKVRHWVSEELRLSQHVMVKDPRAAWLPGLWSEAAHGVGVDIGFVAMLRHPSEVIGSRETHYADEMSARVARDFAIRHVLGWLNQNLTLERLSRGQRRTFVTYEDLLRDWRSVVEKISREFDLAATGLPPSIEDEIDAFIEPSLRRHQTDWTPFDLPAPLITLADQAWVAFRDLARSDGSGGTRGQALDELGRRYTELYDDAVAVASEASAAMAQRALRKGRRDAQREYARRQFESSPKRGLSERLRKRLTAGVNRILRSRWPWS